jgi:ribonucleoside-diphosphate reductase alpha chain
VDQESVVETINALLAKIEELETELALSKNRETRLEERVGYRDRPEGGSLRGQTVQSNVGCGPLYITLNYDDAGKPFEIFFKLGKSGSCQQSYLEALAVSISVGLRYGADPQKFVDKLAGMRCPNPLGRMQNKGKPGTLSCADGISQGLAKALTLVLNAPRSEDGGPTMATVADPAYLLEEADSTPAEASAIDLSDFVVPVALPSIPTNGTHTNGKAKTAVLDARSGSGMCPKCGDVLVFISGCEQCRSQCGHVGKCG